VLVVRKELDERLDGLRLALRLALALRGEARVVDEDVRVGREARDGGHRVVVEALELFAALRGCEEARDDLLLRRDDDARARRDDADRGCRVLDRRDGLLDLVEAACGKGKGKRGREGGGEGMAGG
jgi:hypothetical protein